MLFDCKAEMVEIFPLRMAPILIVVFFFVLFLHLTLVLIVN